MARPHWRQFVAGDGDKMSPGHGDILSLDDMQNGHVKYVFSNTGPAVAASASRTVGDLHPAMFSGND